MRFIDLGFISPLKSVCVDRALLNIHSREPSEDILIVYSRDRPCISAGCFQNIDKTTYADHTNAEKIDIVRRISGGSCIYSDEKQLTYSVVVSKHKMPERREETFRIICSSIVHALSLIGISAEYKPINDVLVNGKKISGSAQARQYDSILQHGSIILELNDEAMNNSLKNVKPRSYAGLTSVYDAIGRIPSRKEITDALISGFSIFGTIYNTELTDEEEKAIEDLVNVTPFCSDR